MLIYTKYTGPLSSKDFTKRKCPWNDGYYKIAYFDPIDRCGVDPNALALVSNAKTSLRGCSVAEPTYGEFYLAIFNMFCYYFIHKSNDAIF